MVDVFQVSYDAVLHADSSYSSRSSFLVYTSLSAVFWNAPLLKIYSFSDFSRVDLNHSEMLIQWCCVLLLTPILSRVQALACDEATEYGWPRNKPTLCCNKCLPGEYLMVRCEQGQKTRCGACGEGYYMDRYNFEMTCRLCTDCAKENMKYKQTCTKTRDAECECKSGYKCSGEQCESCVDDLTAKATTIITTPIKPPLPTETRNTAVTKPKATLALDRDAHLHVDGPCLHRLFAVFGPPRRAQWNPASARKRRRCQCRSRRCAEERRSGRKKSERDGWMSREGGNRFHMRVWVEYEL
ncbi:hypothetical protein SRHO_G00052760 [Serrasalmus rhombeus]